MTALFGVRRVLELEQTFLYLCLHDGGLLDMVNLGKNLEVKKPTAQNYISLLESTHLIHRLPPHGYGKEILRARYKVYLADAAIAPSVLLKGKAMLQDAPAVSRAVETAFFQTRLHSLLPCQRGLCLLAGSQGRGGGYRGGCAGSARAVRSEIQLPAHRCGRSQGTGCVFSQKRNSRAATPSPATCLISACCRWNVRGRASSKFQLRWRVTG